MNDHEHHFCFAPQGPLLGHAQKQHTERDPSEVFLKGVDQRRPYAGLMWFAVE